MAEKKEKPTRERVKAGQVSLPLYPWRDPKTGNQLWRWSWKDVDGTWKYGTRADRNEAVEAAKARARSISRGVLDLEALTAVELDLVRQFVALKPTAADLQRLRDWKEASSTEVGPVIQHWHRVKLAELHDSESAHLRILRQWYAKFAAAFAGRSAAEISASELDAYIRASSDNATSRKYARSRIGTIWKFAKIHGYFDSPEAAKIPAYKEGKRKGAINLWTPSEMKVLLTNAREEYLPWLCFAAFSGLRSEEIRPKSESDKPPMDWSWVRRKGRGGHIEVPAAASKVGKRRLMPITPTLSAWLDHIAPPKKGIVCEGIPSAGETDRLGEMVGGWRKNALRHSYGSNRAAITMNLPALAIEMGNSVAMVERHYREALTKAQAETFWTLTPSEVLRKSPREQRKTQPE